MDAISIIFGVSTLIVTFAAAWWGVQLSYRTMKEHEDRKVAQAALATLRAQVLLFLEECHRNRELVERMAGKVSTGTLHSADLAIWRLTALHLASSGWASAVKEGILPYLGANQHVFLSTDRLAVKLSLNIQEVEIMVKWVLEEPLFDDEHRAKSLERFQIGINELVAMYKEHLDIAIALLEEIIKALPVA